MTTMITMKSTLITLGVMYSLNDRSKNLLQKPLPAISVGAGGGGGERRRGGDDAAIGRRSGAHGGTGELGRGLAGGSGRDRQLGAACFAERAGRLGVAAVRACLQFICHSASLLFPSTVRSIMPTRYEAGIACQSGRKGGRSFHVKDGMRDLSKEIPGDTLDSSWRADYAMTREPVAGNRRPCRQRRAQKSRCSLDRAYRFFLGLWLWLVFSSGGYLPRHWLLPVLVLALFGLMAIWPPTPAGRVSFPSRFWPCLGPTRSGWPRQCYGPLRATSPGSNGTDLRVSAGVRLGLTYFTATPARTRFSTCLWLRHSCCSPSVSGGFGLCPTFCPICLNRFSYPAGYPDNAAALFLVLFWPFLWLASGPSERAPVRGPAIGLATGLLGLALITQSRGALWSMAITLVLLFLLSPARLRLLFYLLVPAFLWRTHFRT